MHEIQVRGPGRPGARPRGRLRRSSVVVAAGVAGRTGECRQLPV